MLINSLDLPTLALVLAGTFGLITLILFIAQRMSTEVSGLNYWYASYAIQTLGATAILQIGQLPTSLSILINNVCFQLGALLILQGVRSYLHRPLMPATLIGALVALYMAYINFYTFVEPSYRMRVVGFSVFYSACHLAIVYILHRHNQSQFSAEHKTNLPARQFLRWVCILTAATHLVRVAILFSEPETHSFLAPQLDARIIMLASIFNAVLLGLALALLTTEHLAEKLHSLSRIDPLTECFNRRAFLEQFNAFLTQGFKAETNQGLCLLMLDLDYFKKINDNYGHSSGDAVLKDFALCAREVIRPQDRLCRWGGEEFAIALPDITPAAAQQIARKLNQTVSKRTVESGGKQINYSVSIGLTHTYQPRPAQVLLEEADEALYSAKTRGRDQVCVA